MCRSQYGVAVAALAVCASLLGCHGAARSVPKFLDSPPPAIAAPLPLTQQAAPTCPPPSGPVSETPPLTIADAQQREPWLLTIEEATRLALANSPVLRDLGGIVLVAPDNSRSVHDIAITETDPRLGVAAALSEFDATFAASGFFEKNDRALNNQFFGGGTRLLGQDLHAYRAAISKRAATGTEYSLSHNVDYDFNNAPGNSVPNQPWAANFEAQVRHPLLRGSGVEVNRIAGPDGNGNGVLLARINTDVTIADFEIGVREFLNDVETAYWELYFAYRDFEARKAARDRALETWQIIQQWNRSERVGGEADKEAKAREQFFRFEAELQDAFAGRFIEPARGGILRGTGGILAHERRLRMLIGEPVSDGRLIRPATEPMDVLITFDWNESIGETLSQRPELRRQRWMVKRRELECRASQNRLLPQLDAVARYRWRGLGHSLLDDQRSPDSFATAYQNLTGGNFQEWQLGFELNVPIGYRKEWAAVRNAQLQLARDRAVLREQEHRVQHALGAAIAEVQRAHLLTETNFNRRMAAAQQLAALEALYQDPDPNQVARLIDAMLEAQQRLADADSRYSRSIVEYNLALAQVHYQKGSLLRTNAVAIHEGPWKPAAYQHAAERESRLGPPHNPRHAAPRPAPVSY